MSYVLGRVDYPDAQTAADAAMYVKDYFTHVGLVRYSNAHRTGEVWSIAVFDLEQEMRATVDTWPIWINGVEVET